MHYTKLEALAILSKAYHYLLGKEGPNEATHTIADKFGYIRRSLRIEDLTPKIETNEGYNGRMPSYF
jgi:hypothetical protein